MKNIKIISLITFLAVFTLSNKLFAFAPPVARGDGTILGGARPSGAESRLVPLHTLSHGERVQRAAFSPSDGHRVVTVSREKMKIWDQNGRSLHTLAKSNYLSELVAFSPPDGRQVVCVTRDAAEFWDTESGEALHTVKDPEAPAAVISTLAYDPEGKRVIIGLLGKRAMICDATNGQVLYTLASSLLAKRPGYSDGICSVDFNDDGRQVVTGSWGGEIKIWDVETGVPVHTLADSRGFDSSMICSVRFNDDGRQLVTGSLDETARLWNAAAGCLVRKFQHSSGVPFAAFSPGGQVVTRSNDNNVNTWDVGTGELLKAWSTGSNSKTVIFSNDWRRVLWESFDDMPEIRDVATGERLHTLEGPPRDSFGPQSAFNDDGSQVLTWSRDGTAKIWDIPGTGQ